MKATFFITFFLIFISQQLKSQKIERKDAADALNFIDTITIPLKSSANNVVAYVKKLKSISTEKDNFILPKYQVDSLKRYYNILLLTYNNAIGKATKNKTIAKFTGLKNSFINMLTEGKKPWATIIPIYIKMYTKGVNKLTIPEQTLLAKASSIFTTSAGKTLEYAKIVAGLEDEIEKKFRLESYNDLHR